MKTLLGFALPVMLVSTSVLAHAAPRSGSPESIALRLIDDAAGDSWAEGGDVDSLTFSDLSCDLAAARCVLSYELKLYGKPLVKESCELQEISGYDDLLSVVKYGFELKDGAYRQVDACLSAKI